MGYLLFLWYVKKCIFLNVIVGTFLPVCTILKKKNNVLLRKKQDLVSKSIFPKGTSGKEGGGGGGYIHVIRIYIYSYRLIFRAILYSVNTVIG